MEWAIALHGGAWDITLYIPPERHQPWEAALHHCLLIRVDALNSYLSALDVVELVVRRFENHPNFNAGIGSRHGWGVKRLAAVSGLTTVVSAVLLA